MFIGDGRSQGFSFFEQKNDKTMNGGYNSLIILAVACSYVFKENRR
jgi:hypothetical protein